MAKSCALMLRRQPTLVGSISRPRLVQRIYTGPLHDEQCGELFPFALRMRQLAAYFAAANIVQRDFPIIDVGQIALGWLQYRIGRNLIQLFDFGFPKGIEIGWTRRRRRNLFRLHKGTRFGLYSGLSGIDALNSAKTAPGSWSFVSRSAPFSCSMSSPRPVSVRPSLSKT